MIQHAFDSGLADASGGPLNDTQLGGVSHAWQSMTGWQSLSTTTKGRRMGVLDGRIAIVTGTSRGGGPGIARALLGAGPTVIGCSRSPLDPTPGIDTEWAARASQQVCDQGDYR